MTRSKKLPLFSFVLAIATGKSLIKEKIFKDSDKNKIDPKQRYKLIQDCNGYHIKIAKN